MRHTRLVSTGLTLMLVYLASGLRAETPEGEHAESGCSATKLTLSVKPAAGSQFTVEANLAEPVPIPNIHDFRLERVDGNEARFVPMVEGDNRSLAWSKSARCRKVVLTLNPARDHDRMDKALEETTREPIANLTAEALLHHEGEYQLTWNCRRGDEVTRHSVRFRYEAEPEADKPPVPELPDRFFLCEILFRHEGVLFLGRRIVPRLHLHDFTMPAVGFDANGKHVSPPDPGYQQIRSVARSIRSLDFKGPFLKPRLAHRIHHYGAQADKHGLTISVTDLATSVEFPRRPDDVIFAFWAGTNPHYPNEAAIFRFERLTGNVERLRQEHSYWKQRTEQIAKEVLARPDWQASASLRESSITAFVLNDADLLKQIRSELRDWLKSPGDNLDDHTREPTNTRRRMRSHIYVLLCLADPGDLPLLTRLAANDASGRFLMSSTWTIGKRYGVKVSANIIKLALRRTGPASDPRGLAQLRVLEPGIPTRLRADEVLIDCCRLLKRSPSEFGFHQAEERLLALEDPSKLTDQQRERFRTAIKYKSGCWYAPTIEARKMAFAQFSSLLDRMRNP